MVATVLRLRYRILGNTLARSPWQLVGFCFGMLGALLPGKSVLITSDHDPRPLHYQLETNFPGQFGWDYLEQGPEVWRVEIDRLEDHGGCDCSCGADH